MLTADDNTVLSSLGLIGAQHDDTVSPRRLHLLELRMVKRPTFPFSWSVQPYVLALDRYGHSSLLAFLMKLSPDASYRVTSNVIQWITSHHTTSY